MVSAAIPDVIEDKSTLVPKSHDNKMYMRHAGEVPCILDVFFFLKLSMCFKKNPG
jgi:hypothetical protein